MSSKSTAVVEAVLRDLSSRKGFDWWWDELDDDIQEEITDELTATVDEVLS